MTVKCGSFGEVITPKIKPTMNHFWTQRIQEMISLLTCFFIIFNYESKSLY
jgi:hypothetical protein